MLMLQHHTHNAVLSGNWRPCTYIKYYINICICCGFLGMGSRGLCKLFIPDISPCPLLLVRHYSAYAPAFICTILSWLEARNTLLLNNVLS